MKNIFFKRGDVGLHDVLPFAVESSGALGKRGLESRRLLRGAQIFQIKNNYKIKNEGNTYYNLPYIFDGFEELKNLLDDIN